MPAGYPIQPFLFSHPIKLEIKTFKLPKNFLSYSKIEFKDNRHTEYYNLFDGDARNKYRQWAAATFLPLYSHRTRFRLWVSL